jgi:hypothetical protein
MSKAPQQVDTSFMRQMLFGVVLVVAYFVLPGCAGL